MPAPAGQTFDVSDRWWESGARELGLQITGQPPVFGAGWSVSYRLVLTASIPTNTGRI